MPFMNLKVGDKVRCLGGKTGIVDFITSKSIAVQFDNSHNFWSYDIGTGLFQGQQSNKDYHWHLIEVKTKSKLPEWF